MCIKASFKSASSVLTSICNDWGRQFQTAGPMYKNAHWPNVRLSCGNSHLGVLEERSLRRPAGRSAMAWCTNSFRQDGHVHCCAAEALYGRVWNVFWIHPTTSVADGELALCDHVDRLWERTLLLHSALAVCNGAVLGQKNSVTVAQLREDNCRNKAHGEHLSKDLFQTTQMIETRIHCLADVLFHWQLAIQPLCQDPELMCWNEFDWIQSEEWYWASHSLARLELVTSHITSVFDGYDLR